MILLRRLVLTRAGVTCLPSSISQLTAQQCLEIVGMSDNEQLGALPAGLCRLPRLTRPKLENVDALCLPDSISQLSVLR